MKLFFALLALTSFAHAEDAPVPTGPSLPACSDNGRDISSDSAAILAAIKAEQFCWQAVQLVENCSIGDGGDVTLVAAAAPVCQKEFESHNPTSQDRILLASMRSACDAKWAGKTGSQYQSMNSHCKIEAWLWMDNLTSENK